MAKLELMIKAYDDDGKEIPLKWHEVGTDLRNGVSEISDNECFSMISGLGHYIMNGLRKEPLVSDLFPERPYVPKDETVADGQEPKPIYCRFWL